MEVAATAKTINRGGGQDPVKHALKSQKDC